MSLSVIEIQKTRKIPVLSSVEGALLNIGLTKGVDKPNGMAETYFM
jgi:hypothetical protein